MYTFCMLVVCSCLLYHSYHFTIRVVGFRLHLGHALIFNHFTLAQAYNHPIWCLIDCKQLYKMDSPQITPSMAKVEAEEASPQHKAKRPRLPCCSGETISDRKAAYRWTTLDGVTADCLNKKNHCDANNKTAYSRNTPDIHRERGRRVL